MGRRASRSARFSCALGILLASACGPALHVETDFSKQASFPGYHTYAFADVPAAAAGQNSLDPLMTEKVREAVDHYLPSKGLVKASDASQADVLVYTWGSTKEKIQVDSWGYAYGGYRYGYMYGPSTSVSNYNEGTLVVDFMDPHRKTVVWRGIATGTVDNREHAARLIPQAVDEMLRGYPPKM